MTSSFHLGVKDPEAVLDYVFDWSAWLDEGATEAIIWHTIAVTGGLKLDSSTASDGVVTAWVSGGIVGKVGTIACRITTNRGRTDERTATLQVDDR